MSLWRRCIRVAAPPCAALGLGFLTLTAAPVCAQEPLLAETPRELIAESPASELPPSPRLKAEAERRWQRIQEAALSSTAADQVWRSRPERWLRRTLAKAPPRVRTQLERALSPQGRQIGSAIVVGLIALLVLARRMRGSGDLHVHVDFPSELRGEFCVRIDTRKGTGKPPSRKERRARATGRGTSTRTEHYEVSRETQFERLRPQFYYVVLEGDLLDPDNGERVGEVYEEKPIEVRRSEAARVGFTVGPRDCPVDVRVVWDKRPAKEAAVAVQGELHSLRYANGGSTKMRLPKGRHTIVAGSGDRVGEQPLDIEAFGLAQIEIDLSAGDHLIFKGCPLAVEPYLNGDVNGAARALERDGQPEVASLMLARMLQAAGKSNRAADHFAKAGHPREAAELYEEASAFGQAGELFEQAGESLRAAEMFRRAGDLTRAGEAYEAGQDLGSAVDCYREAGDTQRWLDALERRGEAFEAARLAIDSDPARAVRLLQKIPSIDPHYPEACMLLADAFEAEGHRDMAASKLEELLSSQDPSTTQPELLDRLAQLHEGAGDFASALDTLHQLRERAPTYPNLSTRVETLRKQVSSDQQADADTVTAGGLVGGPAGFASESRYEIESELGRGGMGIVFKARDTRLNRVVALKRLPDNLRDHPKAIQLFLREAQASARLNHTNIVTLYDVDCIDGAYFITMELLEGLPLNQVLKAKGRIGPGDTARLGIQIAGGLAYAHQQRIVHRDIKTANLFFTQDKVVKIMDFGLAKMMEEVRRASTVIGGTPYYMAPEQATGEAVDHRADIYAFGITLYELSTGTVPFSDGDVVYQHRHTPAPDPRSRFAIPDPLAELILRMIEKDPANRVASAAEAGGALERMLANGL